MRGIFNILDNSANSTNTYTTVQNARLDIIGELDAIIQYETHLMQTNNTAAQKTIKDIVDEEKVHVGQLFGLLFMLDPDSKTFFEKGLKEFESQDK